MNRGLAAVAGLGTLLVAAFVYHRHIESCTPRFDAQYRYFPASGPARARVLLIPGMAGSASNYLAQAPIRQWVAGLTQLGAEVLVLNTPTPRPCWFRDGGMAYRQAFLGELDAITAEATRSHGKARGTLIFGGSYGGVHSLIGFAGRPGMFQGWEADHPVTKLAALDELKSVGEVPAMDPFQEIQHYQGSTGFITWGREDMRVDHRLTERLFALIRSPQILGREYPGGHITTPTQIPDLLADAERQIAAH